MLLPSRQRRDTSHPCPQGWLTCTSQIQVSLYDGGLDLSTAASDGQGHLFCSDELRASLPACHWWQGVGADHLSLAHINAQQTSCGARSCTLTLSVSVHLSPHHQDQLFCAAQVSCRAYTLSAAAGGGQGQLSCFYDSGPILLPTASGEGKREGRRFLPHRCHCIADNRQGQLSHTPTLGPAHPQPPHTESVLLGC